MGAVSEALGSGRDARPARRSAPASPVKRITLEGDRVSGVELESGEKIAAGTVVSNADPAAHAARPARRAPSRHRLRRIASGTSARKGMAAKLHLALDGLPDFARLPAELAGERLVIAPDLVYLEHAFDAAKYGECSPEPALEITHPERARPDAGARRQARALGGRAVRAVRPARERLTAARARVPRAHARRCSSAMRRACAGRSSPSELLLPADIEREFRITGGHWHHGELALDQFLMLRPVPGAAQYAMPVDGLFLCGAGCHPGGGVMGCAGRNAAQAVLATERAA